MIVWNEGHCRRNTTMHEKVQSQNRSGMLKAVRNSVELEHNVFIFVSQIGESIAARKKGREKREKKLDLY